MKWSARPRVWAPSRWCEMMQFEGSFPVPLPDDPYKWDGWSKYKSPNFYERLCLDPRANRSNELIARPRVWAPSGWCEMMQFEGSFPVPLPDDPYKWDGKAPLELHHLT